jgi:hypothetical protein
MWFVTNAVIETAVHTTVSSDGIGFGGTSMRRIIFVSKTMRGDAAATLSG